MNVPLRMPTQSEIAALPPGVLATIETLAPVIHKLFDRIDALEKQLAQKHAPGVAIVDPVVTEYVKDYCWRLEQDVDELKRSAMTYRGVYDPNATYAKGSLCTRHGSMWLSEYSIEPGEMPGHSGSNWKLVVKRERSK